jgi:hypothetical protein
MFVYCRRYLTTDAVYSHCLANGLYTTILILGTMGGLFCLPEAQNRHVIFPLLFSWSSAVCISYNVAENIQRRWESHYATKSLQQNSLALWKKPEKRIHSETKNVCIIIKEHRVRPGGVETTQLRPSGLNNFSSVDDASIQVSKGFCLYLRYPFFILVSRDVIFEGHEKYWMKGGSIKYFWVTFTFYF